MSDNKQEGKKKTYYWPLYKTISRLVVDNFEEGNKNACGGENDSKKGGKEPKGGGGGDSNSKDVARKVDAIEKAEEEEVAVTHTGTSCMMFF